jgi:hypothetical protein
MKSFIPCAVIHNVRCVPVIEELQNTHVRRTDSLPTVTCSPLTDNVNGFKRDMTSEKENVRFRFKTAACMWLHRHDRSAFNHTLPGHLILGTHSCYLKRNTT